MPFVEKLFSSLRNFFSGVGDFFSSLMNVLVKPLSFLLDLLQAIFYFVTKLFDIAVEIIKIFVALFQFVGAMTVGFFRTLNNMLNPTIDKSQVYMPSSSEKGFNVFIDLVDPMGFLDIVPMVCLAILWCYFVFKMYGLLGEVRNR